MCSVIEAPQIGHGLPALDGQVCFALAATSRSVIALYRPVLEPLGLTHPQYLVMLALRERSPRRAGDLSDELLLEPATLSPLLRRLESAGLVTRSKDPSDERALAVALTDAGTALREKALAVPASVRSSSGSLNVTPRAPLSWSRSRTAA